MSSTYLSLPSVSWRNPVPTSADLPATGNQDGDAIVVEDTSTIYIWTGSAWTPVSGGGGGGVTAVTATAPVVSSGGTTPNISMHVADASDNGYLSSTDWSTFNSKQAAGNYITALTGDVAAAGPGSVLATLRSIPNKVYVDFVSGNDSNTGTITQPWKTLQHAYNSISPTINTPHVIYLSGGNNSTDPNPITIKSDTAIVADYVIQVPGMTVTFLSGNSNGCTFVNLAFLGPVTSVRTDAFGSGCTFIACESFSGPVVKNTSTGTCSVTAYNSQFANSEFQLSNGGFGFFNDCTFYGTTTFDDPGSSGFSYIEFLGGYSSGTMSFTGLYNPLYFTGFVHDVAFGAAVSFSAGVAGPSPLEIDANGLPPTYTGTPGTITYLSNASYVSYTPADSSKWAGNPTTVKEALDRIAAVVGNITPIP